nr:MAG TPA: hypothetical protein [Caudoviricetes sp.]
MNRRVAFQLFEIFEQLTEPMRKLPRKKTGVFYSSRT